MSNLFRLLWTCPTCEHKGYVLPEIDVECTCGKVSKAPHLPSSQAGRRIFPKEPLNLKIPPMELDEFFS